MKIPKATKVVSHDQGSSFTLSKHKLPDMSHSIVHNGQMPPKPIISVSSPLEKYKPQPKAKPIDYFV